MPQRKVDDHLEGIRVANSSSQIKGFVYVVPMRRKSEVIQAIKQFAKEIGAPTAIIVDIKFCNDIGTTLWALEEGTPWSNKAKLYIGLLKEAV